MVIDPPHRAKKEPAVYPYTAGIAFLVTLKILR